MERTYWLERRTQALAMAGDSSCDEGRVAHLELARRYGIEAEKARLEGRFREAAAVL